MSDQLHDVAGISDLAIADFFVGLAQKSKSSNDLISKIEHTETLTIDAKVREFANSLYEKVPKSDSGSISSGQKRKNEWPTSSRFQRTYRCRPAKHRRSPFSPHLAPSAVLLRWR